MTIREPAEQLLAFGQFRRRQHAHPGCGRLACQLVGELDRERRHPRAILGHHRHVPEHPPQVVLQPGRRHRRPAGLDVHPRLALLVGRARAPVDLAAHLAQLTGDVAADPELRVDQQLDTQVVPG